MAMQLPELSTLALCPHASVASDFVSELHVDVMTPYMAYTQRHVREYLSSRCQRPTSSPILTIYVGDEEFEVRIPRTGKVIDRNVSEDGLHIACGPDEGCTGSNAEDRAILSEKRLEGS